MPPERAKKLFEGLHDAVEHTVEKQALPTTEHPAETPSEEEKKGMADGLPIKENPELDWLRTWEKEN